VWLWLNYCSLTYRSWCCLAWYRCVCIQLCEDYGVISIAEMRRLKLYLDKFSNHENAVDWLGAQGTLYIKGWCSSRIVWSSERSQAQVWLCICQGPHVPCSLVEWFHSQPMLGLLEPALLFWSTFSELLFHGLDSRIAPRVWLHTLWNFCLWCLLLGRLCHIRHYLMASQWQTCRGLY